MLAAVSSRRAVWKREGMVEMDGFVLSSLWEGDYEGRKWMSKRCGRLCGTSTFIVVYVFSGV